MYRLVLLGGASLEGPSGPLKGQAAQRRVLGVLAILARSSLPVSRERLVGLLWPDHPEDRARARLSDVLYVIRRELGEDVVAATGDALELDGERIRSDAAAFEEAARAGRWVEAVELYGGEFLEGFHPGRSPAFERWVDEERRRLAERYREGLEALAEEAEAAGKWSRAAGWWRWRASEEPTNSRVAARLMTALAGTGDVAGALKHARVHELLLEEELGVSLPAEVRAVSERLAQEGESGRAPEARGDGGEAPWESEGAPRPEAGELPAVGEGPDPGEASGSTGGPLEPAPALEERPAGAGVPAGEGASPGARRLAVPAAVALAALTAAALWLFGVVGTDGRTWVEAEAIPEIETLTEEGRYHDAWTVARRALEAAPEHPELERLLPRFTWRWPELRTDPPGARVLHRPYGERDASWEGLGTTPLEPFRLPLEPMVLRIEREGYAPVHLVPDHYLGDFPLITLDPLDRLPEGMVRIPGWTESMEGEALELGDFLLGRHPVTNREYMRFVEAGGYREPEHWNHPFVLGGDTLSWDGAMERFTDRTGRPGPSTWVGGTYPEGTGDHPVGGISWYEAAAYAEFAGKSLPSVHHWRRAYGSEFFPEHVIPDSNLESDGPAPVGAHAGMGPFGTFDMAGNVREWTYNEVEESRHILGGGWNDPDYMAVLTNYTQPAFDRSPTNGFRLAERLDGDPGWEAARAPVDDPEPPRDFVEEASPPDDREFEIFRRMFAYDPTPLDPELLAADTARHWVRETVAFEAPYEGSRVLVHLYLPRSAEPPFQTVVYWPGDGARTFGSIDVKTELHTDFIIQSGRAVAFPVLKGTLERLEEVEEARPRSGTAHQRDRTVQQVQDLRRTVDYLETRDDIDAGTLGYYGWSWGGGLAPIPLALEPRFEAAVLHVAGIFDGRPLPEVDPLNYLSRVNLPVLMLNGRLDGVYPLETHARPFHELLGTPSEDKRLEVAEGGHFVPQPKLVEESLTWLDEYLGPVERP